MSDLITKAFDSLKKPKPDKPTSEKPHLYRFVNGKLEHVDLVGMYQDQAVFIIAGGPTLNDLDLDGLTQPGIMTFGLNNGTSVFRTNMQVSVDQASKFLTTMYEDPRVMSFATTGTQNNVLWDVKKKDFGTKRLSECPNVVYFKSNSYQDGVSDTWDERWFDESCITIGHTGKYMNKEGVKVHGGGSRSVMLASFKLAYMLGFRRVYLLGNSFFMSVERGYAFDQEIWESKAKSNNSSYGLMTSRFTRLGPAMKERGFQIYNCDPKSFLTLFEYMSLEDAINKERIDTTESTANRYDKDQEAHDFTRDQVIAIKKAHAESTEKERGQGRYWRVIGEKVLGKSKGNGVCAVAEGRVWRDIE